MQILDFKGPCILIEYSFINKWPFDIDAPSIKCLVMLLDPSFEHKLELLLSLGMQKALSVGDLVIRCLLLDELSAHDIREDGRSFASHHFFIQKLNRFLLEFDSDLANVGGLLAVPHFGVVSDSFHSSVLSDDAIFHVQSVQIQSFHARVVLATYQAVHHVSAALSLHLVQYSDRLV